MPIDLRNEAQYFDIRIHGLLKSNHRRSLMLNVAKWIPICIFVQQVSRAGFSQCSVPEKVANYMITDLNDWNGLCQELIISEVKDFHIIAYHCGTNGAIQMASPAWTGYLLTNREQISESVWSLQTKTKICVEHFVHPI